MTYPSVLLSICPLHQEVSCAVLILPVLQDDCWFHLLKEVVCKNIHATQCCFGLTNNMQSAADTGSSAEQDDSLCSCHSLAYSEELAMPFSFRL